MEFSSSDNPELNPGNDTLLREDSSELGNSVPQQLHNQRSHTIIDTSPSVKSRELLAHDGVVGQGNIPINHHKPKTETQKLSTTSSTRKTVVYKESEGRSSLTKNIFELSPMNQDAKLISSLQPSKAEVLLDFHSPLSGRPQIPNMFLDLSSLVANKEISPSPVSNVEDRQEEVGGICKTVVVERGAEFMESHSVIKELEERNSKLVEEKTKLAVQLGVQTKVQYEVLILKCFY